VGEDAKEKGRPKVGGAGSPQFPPVLFSCLRFLNSADPTISEPGTGYTKVRLKSTETKVFLFLAASQLVFVASFRVLGTYHNFISDPKNELSFLETEGLDLIIPSHHQPIKGQNTLTTPQILSQLYLGWSQTKYVRH